MRTNNPSSLFCIFSIITKQCKFYMPEQKSNLLFFRRISAEKFIFKFLYSVFAFNNKIFAVVAIHKIPFDKHTRRSAQLFSSYKIILNKKMCIFHHTKIAVNTHLFAAYRLNGNRISFICRTENIAVFFKQNGKIFVKPA